MGSWEEINEKNGNLRMDSEGDPVMVAVLESLMEEEPFHSSTITLDEDTSMAYWM